MILYLHTKIRDFFQPRKQIPDELKRLPVYDGYVSPSSITALRDNPAYDTTWIPDSQRPGRNIPVHYTSRTDNAIVTDGHSGQDTDMRTYPHVVADGNRPCIFQPAVPLLYIERMAGCIKATVGSDEHIVAKRDLGFVQHDTIHVGIEILANLDVITVIAIEGLLYQEIASRLPKQPNDKFLPALAFRGQQVVILVAQILAPLPFRNQFLIIVRIIQFAQTAFFFFAHHKDNH